MACCLDVIELDRMKNSDTEFTRDLPHHVGALDGLRGVAVLLVVVSHFRILVIWPTPWNSVNNFMAGGFLGVDLFFVLSGFLITSLLLVETKRRNVRGVLRRFYVRRVFRLMPAILVFLASHAILALWENTSMRSELRSARAVIFYHLNWHFIWDPKHSVIDFGHLWSLAIEEQFYIVWPIVLLGLVLIRLKPQVIIGVILFLIFVVYLRRVALWNDGVQWRQIYTRTDSRVDSLLVGALAAFVFRYFRVPPMLSKMMMYVSLLVALSTFAYFGRSQPSRFLHQSGFTLMAILFAFVVFGLANSESGLSKALSCRPLRFVGKISYGLYIWHLPVFRVLARHMETGTRISRLGLGLFLAFMATLISWYAVELPALKLKNRGFGQGAGF